MKLDKLLEDTIKVKLNPRRPLFFTRVRLFLWSNLQEWVQNCNGLLILYTLNSSYYFTIMNISKFRIDFDMELYTNILKFSKFLGENRSMQFYLPCQGKNLIAMMILESKQELTELKRKLEENFYKPDNSQELQFFKRPEVQQLIKQAQITQEALQVHMKLRNEAEAEIKNYFKDLEQLEKTKKNSGFKAYGLGREQWKLEQSQKQYLKDKKKNDVVAYLSRLNKQNKML